MRALEQPDFDGSERVCLVTFCKVKTRGFSCSIKYTAQMNKSENA